MVFAIEVQPEHTNNVTIYYRPEGHKTRRFTRASLRRLIRWAERHQHLISVNCTGWLVYYK